MRGIASISGVLLYGVLFVSCGGEGSNAPAVQAPAVRPQTTTVQKTMDVCALLPKEEVETVLQAPVAAPNRKAGLSTAVMCQYAAQNAVGVALQGYFGAARVFEEYVQQEEAGIGTRAHSVPGIGEKAAYNGRRFIVASKNDLFVITIFDPGNMPQAEKLDVAKRLAQKVLARVEQ
jgi:hypothetical protein